MGGPGRPRREETDRAIQAAALDLLREGGPAAVTVEGVASRSGAAKTTIYRRYTDRDAVLRAALSSAIGAPGPSLGDEPRARIRWSLGELWGQMSDVLGPGGLAAVFGEGDDGFGDLFRSALGPYHAALVELINQDVASGELREGLDPDTAVSLLTGAYLGELLRHGRISDGFLDRCVDLMWVAMAGGSPAT